MYKTKVTMVGFCFVALVWFRGVFFFGCGVFCFGFSFFVVGVYFLGEAGVGFGLGLFVVFFLKKLMNTASV